MQGLIGRKIEPISFQTRWGIHTFFLKEPIDILILDNNHRVAKQKEKLQPNRIFLWNPIWQHVIELPQGTITKEKISLGTKIQFSYSLAGIP